MSTRTQHKQIQDAGSTRYQGRTLSQQLQNAIEDETGVRCDVMVTPHVVSIATNDYTDYLLAKSIVSKRTGLEVVRG